MSVDHEEINELLDIITKWKNHMIDYNELEEPPHHVSAINDNNIYIYYNKDSSLTVLDDPILEDCKYKLKKNNIVQITRAHPK